MVSFNLTPFSSMSTVCFRISTVWLIRSAEEGTALFSGHLPLHSGQQGASSFPTLVPWPLFWATPPHPQIGTHASSRVTGCPLWCLRAGVSGLVRTTPGYSPSALSSFRSLYRSVRKRLWTRVDFPRPDSPGHKGQRKSQLRSGLTHDLRGSTQKFDHSPATMRVKSKPFFTDFRCTWLGSVAKPTYCLSTS